MIVFHFPVLHAGCDTCKNRFECMTMKIHKEFDKDYSSFKEYIPFRIGLACIKLEPYRSISNLKLWSSGNGMEVSADWGYT